MGGLWRCFPHMKCQLPSWWSGRLIIVLHPARVGGAKGLSESHSQDRARDRDHQNLLRLLAQHPLVVGVPNPPLSSVYIPTLELHINIYTYIYIYYIIYIYMCVYVYIYLSHSLVIYIYVCMYVFANPHPQSLSARPPNWCAHHPCTPAHHGCFHPLAVHSPRTSRPGACPYS